jgi:glutaredoxin
MSDDVKACFGFTHRTIYTKDNCPYCKTLMNTWNRTGVKFTEVRIGRDITREEFLEKFPGIKRVPHVVEDE